MSDPMNHAMSSARKFGGVWQDYIDVHMFFDETKHAVPDARHRMFRHHSEGIGWAVEKFGAAIKVSSGKYVSVRLIGEQHMKEDFGFVPTMAMWVEDFRGKSWMVNKAKANPEKETDNAVQ